MLIYPEHCIALAKRISPLSRSDKYYFEIAGDVVNKLSYSSNILLMSHFFEDSPFFFLASKQSE